MKKSILLLSWLLLFLSGFSQERLLRKLAITENEFDYSFYVSYQNDEVPVKNNLTYYWFEKGEIRHNAGGFSGLLLHGTFEKTGPGGELLEKGNFHAGLKDGVWRARNLSGKLIEIVNWKTGQRDGSYWAFDKKMNQTITAEYKNDQLNGWYRVHEDNSLVEKVKFRHGKELVNKAIFKLPKKNRPKKASRNDNDQNPELDTTED